jgi:hypothetical protein
VLQFAIWPALAQRASADSLRRLLSKQGFTGELTGNVQFTKLGVLGCNATNLRVFYYEWEESNPPGVAIHQSKRIILVGPHNEYIGSYAVEDRPITIGRKSLVFDYPEKLGNVIRCDQNGLPKSVLLNGEPQILAK